MALSKMAKQYMIDKLVEINTMIKDTPLDPHADKGHSFDRVITSESYNNIINIIDNLEVMIKDE